MPNGLEHVTFERSGGSFPLTLGGEVVLVGAHTGVRSEATNGIRPLTADEHAMFSQLDPARLRVAPSPLTPPLPEAYQWDVRLDFASGAPVALRWHTHGPPSPTLNTVAPGLYDLAVWVQREIDHIWAHRTSSRP